MAATTVVMRSTCMLPNQCQRCRIYFYRMVIKWSSYHLANYVQRIDLATSLTHKEQKSYNYITVCAVKRDQSLIDYIATHGWAMLLGSIFLNREQKIASSDKASPVLRRKHLFGGDFSESCFQVQSGTVCGEVNSKNIPWALL